MADPINVTITGDQAALRASLSQAQADLKSFQNSIASTTAQMNAMGASGQQLKVHIDDYRASAANAEAEVARLTAALNTSTSGTDAAAGGLEKAGHASTGFYRELIVLGHEMGQGNFSRFGGSMLVLAERMGNLETIASSLITPMGALGVAAAGLVVGLGVLAVRAIEASNALNRLQASLAFGGTFDTDAAGMRKMADEIANVTGVTTAQAAKLISSTARAEDSSKASILAMSEGLVLIAKANSESLDEVQKKADKYLNGDLSKHIKAFAEEYTHDAEQIRRADELQGSGDVAGARQLMLEIITDAVERTKAKVKELPLSFTDSMMAGLAMLGQGGATEFDSFNAMADKVLAKFKQVSAEMTKNSAEAAKEASSSNTILKQGNIASDKADPDRKARADAVQEVKALTAALKDAKTQQDALSAATDRTPEQNAKLAGLTQRVAEFTSSLEKANDKISNIEMAPYVATVKQGLEQVSSDRTKTQAQNLAAEAAYLRQSADNELLSTKEREKLIDEAAKKDIAATAAAAKDIIRIDREKIDAINANDRLSQTQKTAAIAAVYRAEASNVKLSVEEQQSARHQAAVESIRLTNETHQQHLKTLQEATSEAVKGSNERVAAAQAEVAYTTSIWKAGSAQQIEAQHHLTQALKEQVDIWVGDYEKGIKHTLQSTTLNEQQKLLVIRNAIASIGAENSKNKALLDRLRAEEDTQFKKAQAEKVALVRDEVNQEIAIQRSKQQNEIAQDDIDLSLGRIRYAQKFANMQVYAQQTYSVEVQGLQRELALYAEGSKEYQKTLNQMAAAKRRFENESLAITRQSIQQQIQSYTELTQAIVGPVGNAITGLITKTMTLQQAVQSIFQSMVSFIIQKIEEWVTQWIVSMIMGQTSTASTNAMTVGSNAAVSASGAYAATALIPYVGPILAPEAAALAYAETMAYAPLTALDVGAWNIPHDMPANIHAGEMVVPATFAQGLRDGGGIGGGGSDTYNINISAWDGRSVQQTLMQHGPAIVKSIAAQKRNSNGAMT